MHIEAIITATERATAAMATPMAGDIRLPSAESESRLARKSE